MTHRYYLALAIPLIFATITVPLLGAVDTAVVGQLPNPAFIGGVAVGTIIFNTMYWLFGFLRVSTSGFAAQSLGAGDSIQSKMAIIRPICIALFIGIMFIVFQKPILTISLFFLGVEGAVKEVSMQYFYVRIWGSPFSLMNYVILGWLLGMAHIKETVVIQVLMNIVNIILSILLVLVFDQGIIGIAIATLLAEIFAFCLGLIFLVRNDHFRVSIPMSTILQHLYDREPLKK